MARIVGLTARDVRFPTSRTLAGSDAMHTAPDYSAAYVVLTTDAGDHLEGHGLTFTLGRGTEVCVAAVNALAPIVIGRTLESITADMRGFWRAITGEHQLRWLGPEKGAIHLASGAIVNAVWDLYAKVEGKPLWKLLVDISPEQLVACIDFRYISDVLTPAEAFAILKRCAPTRAEREAEMLRSGFPAYTTSAGWLGYSDEKLRALCREAVAGGWTHMKLKVGQKIEDDVRRAGIVREEIGANRRLMMDANQVWDVDQAITYLKQLVAFDPYWIEEPTSPDDVLGHATIARAIAPVKVATGEHCQNRVIFKQLFQADAIGFCQLVARQSSPRICRAPARAFPRPCPNPRRALCCAAGSRFQHHDAPRIAARVRISVRPCVEDCLNAGVLSAVAPSGQHLIRVDEGMVFKREGKVTRLEDGTSLDVLLGLSLEELREFLER